MVKNNIKTKLVVKLILVILVITGIIFSVFCAINNGVFDNKTIKNTDENNEENEDKADKVSSDLFGEYYAKATTIIGEMSLEERVGQLFLARYNSSTAFELITNYHPGGFILFAKDFNGQTKQSISEQLKANQSASKIALVLGVDEEGGTVTRVSRYSNFRSKKFPSPQEVFANGGFDELAAIEKEKAELLLSIGINLNLAPVCDVSTSSKDFIYDRSFGKPANQTALYAYSMVRYANKAGISSSLKHFPGYGNNVDTHTGVAIDKRSYDYFEENDFLPFIAGIKAKVPTILVSHNVVKCMDEKYPSSLSSNVHKILREELGFTGIIMTDDLAMDAVDAYVKEGDAATLAINAGNDMIITNDFVTMFNEVLESVNNGKISMDTINTAVIRIIAWKLAYGIIG